MDGITTHRAGSGRPPAWVSLILTLTLVGAMAALRLGYHNDQWVPLGFGVPLLVCLWTRDRSALWVMAGAFSAITLLKVFMILPLQAELSRGQEWAMAGMMLVNIHLVAGVLHAVIGYREHLERTNGELEATNAELEASNEELSAREEEITQQNEELQRQAEEMERQAEELRQINEELIRRERAMHMLLESAAGNDGRCPDDRVMARLCEVATHVLAGEPAAAAIVLRDGERMVVRGHCGFGPAGPVKKCWDYRNALGSLVMERGQTARLDDTTLRPDLEMPQPADGRIFRSVLAAPLRVNGRAVGAMKIFSERPRDWTGQDFRVVEWLAAQAGLVLESIGMKRELEGRRVEAEEASRRKTRFLAAVSHDVRTPANAINLMAELIQRTASDPAAQAEIPDMARDLQSNARALVELVSDVLDLARFDSGKLDLQEIEFDVCAAIRSEVRQLAPLAHAKGLRIAIEGCGKPRWLRTDRMKLMRTLTNLIGNAIKFTETGCVTIACEGGHGGGLLVRVSDTGPGISPEHLPHIFDEFHQLRNPERDRNKGAGLGLAICKRLTDAMGWELSVRSETGRGSTFTLLAPASHLIDAPAPARLKRPGDGESGRGVLADLRVLLVEDHDATRHATARLLASEGAVVAQAATGREALHLLAHESPEVLLLDLMLPDLDGSDILRHIQQDRPASLRCVLAVSGDVTEARERQVRQLGADALVPKPVDLEHLVRLLTSTASGNALPASRA